MEGPNDDFGELYADFQFQSNSSINCGSQSLSHFSISNEQEEEEEEQQQQQSHCGGEAAGVDERRESDIEVRNEVGLRNDSESDDDDDDFDVFVNDDDFGAMRNGGGDAKLCSEEVVENAEGEFGGGSVEGGLIGNNQMRVDFDGVLKGGSGNDDGCGGDKGNVGKIGSNLQCKYQRRNDTVFVGSQRAVSSWKAEREGVWYGQPRVSSFVPGLAGCGNSFCLPWYKTIVDVDIDTIEQKSWTDPGADLTDYFNYDFNEESWKNYCRSLDQLRRQTLSQTRNQVNQSLRFKLKNDAGAIKEMQSGEFVDAKSIQLKQIGQAIQVEDNNAERQPSTDARRPRFRDSDVVIEITVQDPEEPCSSGNELCNAQETQCNMSEKRCDAGNCAAEVEQPNGSKAHETGNSSLAFRSSSVSCDSKRSDESAAVSSHVLQHSDDQGKDQNYELDIEPLDKGDGSSGRNLRAIGTVNYSMKDVDNGSDTAETNPCVAGIDLSFDNHGPSSRSPSYFNTCSETSQDDLGYLKKNQHLRRSPDSKKEKSQVAHTDYQRTRRIRDDKNKNENGYKYNLRVRRNSIEENLKHEVWKVGKRVELKYSYGVDRSRAHRHLRSEEWWHSTSDDEYWSGYRENESSPGYYDKRSVENRFHVDCMRDFDRRDQWRSRDEVDMCFQREWDEGKPSSDRRMRRMRGVIAQKDRRIEEREYVIRDEKPYFRNRNFMKFSSSRDINCSKQGREFDDVDFNKRNRRHKPLQYSYGDDLVYDRFERSNPFDDRHTEYVNSDIEREKHSWHSRGELRTFGRKEFFESSMDVDYSRCTVDYDDEYWNTQISSPTHDLRDNLPYNDERRHRNSFYRDDTNKFELYQRYERHNNSISGRKGRGNRHAYDHRIAYNQQAPRYLDEDEYFGKRRNVFQSNGSIWTEDTLFDECSDDDFYGGRMLDSFEGVSSHKRHGVESGFVHGEMTVHKEIPRGRFGVVGCDKSYSKMSTRANFEENGTWGRNSLELRQTVRERKSTGDFSKVRILPNNDADGRFREQFKRRQKQDGAFPNKIMEKKTCNVEASWENLSAGNCANTSELEEGQIPKEEPRKDLLKGKKYGSGHFAQKDTLKGELGNSQMSQNDGHIYDENRILETMAKMEKRRERFKEPVLVKKDTDSDAKPEDGKVVEMDSKGQRPIRKRKWG